MRILGAVLMVVVLVAGFYWLYQQPDIREEAHKTGNVIADFPEALVEAAAKISNDIEDAELEENTKEAWEGMKHDVRSAKERMVDDFEEAKRKDREKNNP